MGFLLSILFARDVSGQVPDPEQEWFTESVSSVVQQQLELVLDRSLTGQTIDGLIELGAVCTDIENELLRLERDDGLVEIHRLVTTAGEKPKLPLLKGLNKLTKILGSADAGKSPPRLRLKISRIKIDGDEAHARVLLFANRSFESYSVQLNSVWETRWSLSEKGAEAQLKGRTLVSHEEIQIKSESPWFVDATAAVFSGPVFADQLAYGMNTWIRRIEKFAGSAIFTRHGIALGDVNGDGLDDLYVCQPGGLPNRLFLQQQDGTLVDNSSPARIDWLNDTRSAIFVDLDNDGDQDLVVGTSVGVFLCRNDGTGKFDRIGQLPGLETDITSLSAVDFDNDGHLDIYVCVDYGDKPATSQGAVSVYDERALGGANRLYKNPLASVEDTESQNNEWKFRDVTFEVGLTDGNNRFSLAAAWEDYDSDGDQDLYIANDYGRNNLYRNDGGKFSEVTKELGVEDYGPGMSVSWGDYNRDGLPDLYLANMFSAAGSRITRQSQFRTTAPGTSSESFQRFSKGNSLYTFNGKTFDEVDQAGGAQNALWAWSSLLADIDNDGWDDALVANGYITGPKGGDL